MIHLNTHEGEKNMSAKIRQIGMFQGVITSNLALFIFPPNDGQIDILNLNFFSDAIGTLTFYRANLKEKAAAALSAGTGLQIDTDAAGLVTDGAVVTTSDFVIATDASGVGQLRGISTVSAVASSVVTLTLDANATVADNQAVYIVRAANVVQRATTNDERTIDAKDQATSFDKRPLAVEVSATGTNELSGKFRIVEFT